jgi:hypothetical protein
MDKTSPKNGECFFLCVKKIGDGLSIPKGALCHEDASSWGRLVLGMQHPGDVLSWGCFNQGTFCLGMLHPLGRFVLVCIVRVKAGPQYFQN